MGSAAASAKASDNDTPSPSQPAFHTTLQNKIRRQASLVCGLVGLVDGDHAAMAAGVEVDGAGALSEDRVITPDAGALA